MNSKLNHIFIACSQRKNLFTIISIGVILTILRETGMISINAYSSRIASASTPNFHNSKETISLGGSVKRTKKTRTIVNNQPITIRYENETLYADDWYGEPIEVTIENINTGFLWTPLFKSSSFSATANLRSSINDRDAYEIIYNNINGHIQIEGEITVYGICSHREAVNLIKKRIIESIISDTRDHFSNSE